MMKAEIRGIVIAHRVYREYDAMLKILCDDGKIYTVVCKGVQKINSKNAPATLLFTKSSFLLHVHENSTIQMLRSATILQSYRSIREDLYKQSIATYMCEGIEASAFEENMYTLMEQCLTILTSTNHPITILCAFQATLNRLHGIEPYVDGCIRCNRLDHMQAISLRDGGFVCSACYQEQQDIRKTASQLRIFRRFCKIPIHHYAQGLQDLGDDFDDFMSLYMFFDEYAGISLKSIRFLKHLYTMEKSLP